MTDDKNLSGHLALLGANVIFGLNMPISKTVLSLDFVTPYTLNLFRMGGAAILFWIASLFCRREKVPVRDILLLFAASLFGVQLNQVSFLIGLSMTAPVDASIVATTVPIITMIISALYLKEPITWKKVIGVLVGASGAIMLIMSAQSASGGESHLAGNLLCLLSAASFATYLVLFKKLIGRYSSVTLMKWMFLFAALCNLPFCWGDFFSTDFSRFTWDVSLRVAYVVGGATFLAYLMIPVGQRLLRPTIVSMYNYVQPLVASLVAVLIGLDAMNWTKGVAAILVFSGVYIVTLSKSRAQLEAEKAARAEKNRDNA